VLFRSAQLLAGLGFKEVYNLAGGIKAYRGQTAAGPQELNLDLVRGDEGPAEITLLAAGMERALQLFYETLKDRTRDRELQELFGSLARVEERHRQRLGEVYRRLEPGGRELDDSAAATATLEGGFPFQEFLAANEAFLDTAPHVLDLAMMLETQALDLYLRLARRAANPLAQTILLAIAEEEKGHLVMLGQLLAAKTAGAGH
jgi:rubrerythrin